MSDVAFAVVLQRSAGRREAEQYQQNTELSLEPVAGSEVSKALCGPESANKEHYLTYLAAEGRFFVPMQSTSDDVERIH